MPWSTPRNCWRSSRSRRSAHRRVIRLHYLRGDRAAALLAFDRCEQMLKDEVGVRPSADTLALLATIERAVPDAELQPLATVPAALQRPPRLIGRDAERRALARAIDEGGVRLLTGQAGMGKSRLIAELVEGRDCARPTPRAAWSVCARPGDAAAPYALAARWLRGLTLRADLQLTAAQRGALACVLAELGPAGGACAAGRSRAPARGHAVAARRGGPARPARRGHRRPAIRRRGQRRTAARAGGQHGLRLDHRDAARRTRTGGACVRRCACRVDDDADGAAAAAERRGHRRACWTPWRSRASAARSRPRCCASAPAAIRCSCSRR